MRRSGRKKAQEKGVTAMCKEKQERASKREGTGRGRATDGETGNMQQPLSLYGRRSGGNSRIQSLLVKSRGNGIRAVAACACSGEEREAVYGPAAENNIRMKSEAGTDEKRRAMVGV
ncbi:hypothetical protein Baya_3278 [Bagarius yarrelli]|uniref:Uncharacterized protein n=1 Tax=Bagarius yarrelli TaxID=175774 RepID=A0A556TS66_BAGYA|nr:hypothetical protein Baya_3278 [Bagarius yarrelli]